ncbi:SLAM family member 9-like isoform X2 [Ursus maritimus]|nr:SLAM family member 9-like isoform X2 [Ursus maritimus]
MGTCSEDPHLGGASWLLGFTSLLLSVCSALTQSSGVRGSGVEDSGIPVSLKETQGASVSFHVIRKPELPPEGELEKILWGIVYGSNYRVMLNVLPGRNVPEWLNFQDKFKMRVHVPSVMTLTIDNLTLEDSGLYRVRVFYSTGTERDEDFHLTVYEPVPLPQIRATVLSLTPGWCNVTVECDTTGTREDLTVSWESEGLPRELEQRPSMGPAPNPWTLAVTLPLSQPSASLTCVVRNHVDQKTATWYLGDVCGHETGLHGQVTAALLRNILRSVVIVLLILGAGLYLWKTRGEKKNVDSGRGRLHFSFLSPDPSLPHWTPGSLFLHFAAQGMSRRRLAGVAVAVGSWRGRVQVSRLRLQLRLCMTQVQDRRRTTGTRMLASTMQS